ncbi:hypothetical protein GQ54DRAFT_318774 [Martensiomyces pterosporus]|nr:hypothetical protein GQ54DRAFT_318774 [Martensiomyces pterosporus]
MPPPPRPLPPLAPIINPFGPPARQPPEASRPVALQPVQSSVLGGQRITAFVGGISDNVPDEWVEKLLSACGEVNSWNRVCDANEKPQAFGFCEFKDIKSAVCALHILSSEGGLKQGGWSLPCSAASKPKTLIIRLDNSVHRLIESRSSLPSSEGGADSQAEREALESVKQIISQLAKSMDSNESADTREHENDSADSSDERNAPDNSYTEGSLRTKAESLAQSDPRDGSAATGAKGGEHEENSVEESFSLEDEEKWEAQQAEAHRHRRYLSGAVEREYRLTKAEEEREIRMERNAIRELDKVEERQRERDSMSIKLAQWDDEQEEKLRDHSYYRDRERWWHHRKMARERELELDRIDRQQEQQQQEQQQQEQQHSEHQAGDDRQHTGVSTHSGRLSSSDRSTEQGQEQPKEAARASGNAELAARSKDDGCSADTQSKPERRSLIERLIEEIPADPEQLFGWHVKWDYVDEDMMSNRIEPATRKRLVEYLGGESDDGSLDELTEFVIGHIRDRKPPQGLVDELEMILVEEAPVFVARIWRVVVYESEARARNID